MISMDDLALRLYLGENYCTWQLESSTSLHTPFFSVTLADGMPQFVEDETSVRSMVWNYYLWLLVVLIYVVFVPVFSRKVKEAWDNKRDMLIKSGAFTIEQLSAALSASSDSDKLPDGVPDEALGLCSEQVRLCASILSTLLKASSPFLRHKRGEKTKKKMSFHIYGLAVLHFFSFLVYE